MGTRDCGSTDALKVNINAFDASGIFRDVYKHIMSTADRGSTRFKEGVGDRYPEV